MLDELRIKLFADGADVQNILALAAKPWIKGFTTNPTLMRKAGVTDYRSFAREVVMAVGERPVSFEVFADEIPEMEGQAYEIASWGSNVNVKIPVTNTRGEPMDSLIGRLSAAGVKVNVTAVFTLEQVRRIVANLAPQTPAIISVFAGRIADTGLDPLPIMTKARNVMAKRPKAELLWASPRELLNVVQADDAGCHIITVTTDLLHKLCLLGKDLDMFSLETVQMFHRDAAAAGYRIDVAAPVRTPG